MATSSAEYFPLWAWFVFGAVLLGFIAIDRRSRQQSFGTAVSAAVRRARVPSRWSWLGCAGARNRARHRSRQWMLQPRCDRNGAGESLQKAVRIHLPFVVAYVDVDESSVKTLAKTLKKRAQARPIDPRELCVVAGLAPCPRVPSVLARD
jgi:hypothetical protein